jgi:ribonuclease HII
LERDLSPPNLEFEKEIWAKGRIPAGVDEAGRGPLAGPVVAAAVVLPDDCKIEGLDDSKKLSHSKREKILEEIKSIAISYAVGIVEPEEIDKINILRASLLAMEISVKQLTTKPDYLLIDGNQKTSLLLMQETIVKGDSKSCSIAAASILAKVTRDSIMEEYHSIYPEYNFKGHKGYPTKEHYQALREYGPCPIHRKTFRGVL